MQNNQDRVTYQIDGMHCGGCVAKVQKFLSSFASKVSVTLTPPQVVLEHCTLSLADLNTKLATLGDYHLSEDAIPNVTEAVIPITAAPVVKTSNQTLNAKPMENTNPAWYLTYKPILLIFGYLLLGAFAIQAPWNTFDVDAFMRHIMAGFFLVFSFFKLLNLKAFANSYAMYDLLAMALPAYGMVYPFLELGLGFAYLMNIYPSYVNWVTLILMAFSSLGVIKAVMSKQKVRCACLGSVFNLPMSTITIIEDLLMVVMAAWMLL